MPAEEDVGPTTAAVIFAGGDAVPDSVRPLLPEGALVIAADSGLHSALRLGIAVHLVVGDFDSADPAAIAAATRTGARLERHPADKDATDLELALDAALARGLCPVLVVGGAGWDRIDHLVANAMLLAAPRYSPLQLRWSVKGAEVTIVHDHARIRGAPGDTVSLLATAGPAEGVTTTGLRWPLLGETLSPGSTRGVSNQLTGEIASVSLASGVLLAVHLRRTT